MKRITDNIFHRCLVRIVVIMLMFCGTELKINAQISAQWRGANRDGIYPDTGLLHFWPEGGPAMVWSSEDIGNGYSSPVSYGKRLYITGTLHDTDFVTAINEKGKTVWQVGFGPSGSGSYTDARCTPVVEDGRVYVLSGAGTIACLNADNGSLIWSFDALARFEGKFSTHGLCESLLLCGEKLFYTPGGTKTTVVALNKYTGETIWTSESLNDVSAYVSPIMVRHADRNIFITLLSDFLIGVDAENGKILWKYNFAALNSKESEKIWYASPKINAVTPLFREGYLYITGGYNHGGAMFRLSDDAESIDLVWTDSILDCHHGGVVLIDGYIYGSNWINNSKGIWCCLEWKTGKICYTDERIRKGSVISSEGMLYCYEEKNGILSLVHPDTSKVDIVSSFKITIGNGPHWAHPVIDHGFLYIRHGNALIAYDIRGKGFLGNFSASTE